MHCSVSSRTTFFLACSLPSVLAHTPSRRCRCHRRRCHRRHRRHHRRRSLTLPPHALTPSLPHLLAHLPPQVRARRQRARSAAEMPVALCSLCLVSACSMAFALACAAASIRSTSAARGWATAAPSRRRSTCSWSLEAAAARRRRATWSVCRPSKWSTCRVSRVPVGRRSARASSCSKPAASPMPALPKRLPAPPGSRLALPMARCVCATPFLTHYSLS